MYTYEFLNSYISFNYHSFLLFSINNSGRSKVRRSTASPITFLSLPRFFLSSSSLRRIDHVPLQAKPSISVWSSLKSLFSPSLLYTWQCSYRSSNELILSFHGRVPQCLLSSLPLPLWGHLRFPASPAGPEYPRSSRLQSHIFASQVNSLE